MNFIEKLKESLVTLREEDESYEYELEDVEVPEAPARAARPRVSLDDFTYESDNVKQIKPDISYDVVLATLRSIDDAPDVVNNLRVNHVCIVNLEGVELEVAQRIADFLGGASFAMNGSIEKINENIFVMAPLGINIKDLIKRSEKSSGIFSWVSKAARFY